MLQAAALADVIRSSGLFDDKFYCANAVRQGVPVAEDSIIHYILIGDAAGIWPNPLFDPVYYKLQAGTTDCALVHYVQHGAAAGLRTHPLFDSAYYMRHNPDVVNAKVNPLRHFLASGGSEGRRPHPLFHTWNYAHSMPGLVESGENPLVYYLRQGWREPANPHPLFDGAFYQINAPESVGQNPLQHFVCYGLAAGRRPNLRYSAEAFRRTGVDPHRLMDEAPIAAAGMAGGTSDEDYAALSAEIARQRGPRARPTAKPRLIAFYLPQFHPIPENDSNWGEGFTEWANVRKAKPNFAGHNQPRLPTELGYYDLRDPATMVAQAALAQAYGIHGFCFYWYWFNGHKPLALPLEHMLQSGRPNHPFCLCWANEGWTRKWAGGEEVILSHTYSGADDYAHAIDLTRYMKDSRYIRVDGAPLLLVYRAGVLPDTANYLVRWRAIFAELGIADIHLAMVESAEFAWAGQDPRELGFDSSVEFPPHGGTGSLPLPHPMINPAFTGSIFDYRDTVLRYAVAPLPDYPRARTVMLAWDNTPRYQDTPAVFVNTTPGGYQAWLEAAIADVSATQSPPGPLVFINAWNEWGEGTYLEPDGTWGRAFLEATRAALASE